jgi:hypothetical protein
VAHHLHACNSGRFSTFNGQIDILTLDPSFGHNLCCKYSNGSCKPISNIYVSRDFQWYKEIFNPMSFDLCHLFLKIWEFIGALTPKVGVHLGVWGFIPSHCPTFPRTWNVIPGFHFSPTPSQALALVVSPRLGLQHLWVKQGHRTVWIESATQ